MNCTEKIKVYFRNSKCIFVLLYPKSLIPTLLTLFVFTKPERTDNDSVEYVCAPSKISQFLYNGSM